MNILKRIKAELKYKVQEFRWIKALFSPFKPFSISWYAGKTELGVPYFLPRKWVKRGEKHYYAPLKIGFSYCGLGWKIKWTDHDYRHEWDPRFSFVFFGYQIAATFTFKECYSCMYWECWLCYEYSTDKTKSTRERIAQCRELMPQIWTRRKDDDTDEVTDYYNIILKPKYLK